MENISQKYALSSRVIHWLMAVIIISMLCCGIYMADFLSKESEYRMTIYNLHKSFGVIVLCLVAVRIINRIIYKAPALPKTMAKWEIASAHAAHMLLYVLMIAIPLSGYLMSNSFGYPVHLFSIELPMIAEKNFELGKFFAQSHKYLSYAMIAVLVLHVLGALKHRFFDKKENDVLGRML